MVAFVTEKWSGSDASDTIPLVDVPGTADVELKVLFLPEVSQKGLQSSRSTSRIVDKNAFGAYCV